MKAAHVTRRRFLERLGLGAGASVLASVADATLARAQGAATARKRVVFVMWSNGLPRGLVMPQSTLATGTAPNADDNALLKGAVSPVLPGMKDFPWPQALASLEKVRARTLIVDNLTNRVNYEHSTGYGALSAFNGDVNPGGISIDQHIANGIGRASVLKSLNWGVGGIYSGGKATEAVVFASGPQRPLPHVITPDGLFKKVFTDTDPATFGESVKRRRLMIDPLRQRLQQMAPAFAPAERRTLEHYSAALEDYDARMKLVKPVACAAPAAPGMLSALEDRLTAMNEMSILALTCGLTNVAGISVGCGYAHSGPLWDKLAAGTQFAADGKLDYHGHDPKTYQPAMTLIIGFIAGMVARMVDAWSKIPDGNGTLMDNTTIVMLSDSGGTSNGHHRAFTMGWPVVIVGNAGGALKTDGRYLRYPSGTGGRALADLWSTIATASGVPTSDFGKGGAEAVSGPLPELMA